MALTICRHCSEHSLLTYLILACLKRDSYDYCCFIDRETEAWRSWVIFWIMRPGSGLCVCIINDSLAHHGRARKSGRPIWDSQERDSCYPGLSLLPPTHTHIQAGKKWCSLSKEAWLPDPKEGRRSGTTWPLCSLRDKAPLAEELDKSDL